MRVDPEHAQRGIFTIEIGHGGQINQAITAKRDDTVRIVAFDRRACCTRLRQQNSPCLDTMINLWCATVRFGNEDRFFRAIVFRGQPT
jgi:hypothetical protein